MTVAPATAVDARIGHGGSRIDLDGACRHYRVGVRSCAPRRRRPARRRSAFVVALGASGSDKTTLLNLIGALDSPTAGTVRPAGIDLTSVSRTERNRVRSPSAC